MFDLSTAVPCHIDGCITSYIRPTQTSIGVIFGLLEGMTSGLIVTICALIQNDGEDAHSDPANGC